MARLFKKVAIVGIGLIGGSLGMAIRQRGIASRVIGISRTKKTINKAKKAGAIDDGFCDFKPLSDCELIILCSPVNIIINTLSKIKPFIAPGTIITDVGSTKSEIVKSAGMILPKGADFIGAHPLAGSEKSGIDNANGGLFEKSLCVLTPLKTNSKKNIRRLESFWLALGSRVSFLTPSAHDKITSFTSHLPHLIAFNLLESIPAVDLRYAASGLRDATRIAASDPLVWADIFISNRAAILKSAGKFQTHFDKFLKLLKSGDSKRIIQVIKKAKFKRDTFLNKVNE